MLKRCVPFFFFNLCVSKCLFEYSPSPRVSKHDGSLYSVFGMTPSSGSVTFINYVDSLQLACNPGYDSEDFMTSPCKPCPAGLSFSCSTVVLVWLDACSFVSFSILFYLRLLSFLRPILVHMWCSCPWTKARIRLDTIDRVHSALETLTLWTTVQCLCHSARFG